MRRVMYLWLPLWPIDRRRLSDRQHCGSPAEAIPFATVTDAAGQRLLATVNPAAAAAGLAPGMPLADALSFFPALATAAAEPAEDATALRRLAEWCGRYSPWIAPDGVDGIRIEITGSAHLWGGEGRLAADLMARLERRHITGRIAIADTLGAAWAMARYAEAGQDPAIVLPGDCRAALAPLPVEALRLDLATVQGLRRVGLKRVGDLYQMPRDALARRFGEMVARQLDQAQGDLPEPLSPLCETPARRVRLSFAEPIADPADLLRATERLMADLVPRLAREGVGARRLDLAFHRVDGRVERIRLGTAHPSRDARHLVALFKERLETVDPGLGIEDVILAAFAVEPLPAEQIDMAGHRHSEASDIASLLDRLGNRLGLAAVSRLEPRQSHIPERASVRVTIASHSPIQPCGLGPPSPAVRERVPSAARRVRATDKPPRPIRLFEPPEPVEAFWLLPDDPPFRFTWRRRRHRVTRADGPERIAEEWWRPEGSVALDAIRDYYRVEDEEGRRFWLFRAGLHGGDRAPRWFVHGVFS
jgi:protein ImuB